MSWLRRAAYAAGIIIMVLLLAYVGLGFYLHSSAGRFPTKGAKYPSPHIRNLVWPTIGCPALVPPGGTLEVEADLRGAGGGVKQAPASSGWLAEIKPARKALSGIAYRLSPTRAWRAASSRWPRASRGGASGDVWHAEFKVPAEAVPELYDLSIEVDSPAGHVRDGQAHSVSVFEGRPGDLTFVSLADIHVHRRDISGAFQRQSNKGITPNGRPVFFERAIDQVNFIRPDFAVMLGDFVRAQHSPGDYQIEFESFYRELLRLEVPVFAVPGNHDMYVNEVDGSRVWEQNLGPLYYSFNAGGCRFDCVDTNQWPVSARTVMRKLWNFVYPLKWQGRVLGAQREDNVATYSGQLGWLRDDLSSRGGVLLRIMLLHHDPYRPDGKGTAYDNQRFAGVFSLGGGGKGRSALKELASLYEVDMVMSGHDHSDYVARVPWRDGKGATLFANQTCVGYDEGGKQEKYPGYRLVRVRDGRIREYSYLDGTHSIPFYDGTSLQGKNDLDHLDRDALRVKAARPSCAAGWEVVNYLGSEMELRGLVAVAPSTAGGYRAEGGEVYRAVSAPGDPGLVVLYVRALSKKGVPGKDATTPGTPSKLKVTLVPAR